MKLSTKIIKEKIKAHELAKAAEEKRAEEQKKLDRAKSRQKAKFLNEISEKILNAALEGSSKVEIGVDCESEVGEISHILEDRSLEVEEVFYSEYLEGQLARYLDKLNDEEVRDLKKSLFESSRSLRQLCEEIKKTYPQYFEDSMIYVIDLFLEIYKEDENLIDQITSLNLGCLELKDALEDLSEPEYSEIYYQVIEDLSNIFKDTWLFQNIDEETIVFFVKWGILDEDDILDYEPVDDYFNSLGLAWLASTHGQLFITALENLVEQKIEGDESSLKMRLYKFSSGFRIEMENKSEVYTLLDEVGLTRLFTKLGYKVNSSETEEADEIDILISWNSVV